MPISLLMKYLYLLRVGDRRLSWAVHCSVFTATAALSGILAFAADWTQSQGLSPELSSLPPLRFKSHSQTDSQTHPWAWLRSFWSLLLCWSNSLTVGLFASLLLCMFVMGMEFTKLCFRTGWKVMACALCLWVRMAVACSCSAAWGRWSTAPTTTSSRTGFWTLLLDKPMSTFGLHYRSKD